MIGKNDCWLARRMRNTAVLATDQGYLLQRFYDEKQRVGKNELLIASVARRQFEVTHVEQHVVTVGICYLSCWMEQEQGLKPVTVICLGRRRSLGVPEFTLKPVN
jgi:hypothetical protein